MGKLFGKRLKEERERLGMSQSVFAERQGIHRNTQIKYESGERLPDSFYLGVANEIGVDTNYLYSGVREEERDSYTIADGELAKGVYGALGFSQEETKAATLDLAKLVAKEFQDGGGVCEGEWDLVTLPNFVSAFLSRSPLLSKEEDLQGALSVELLASVLDGFDTALLGMGRTISTAKKAQACAMLYRAFKISGTVEPCVIKDAVKLVS